ncbi:MAG: hypothetical protein GX558_09820, partial [Clostridiales bacterium]|nr:hypothetical protein [Clostridiales bacterium]
RGGVVRHRRHLGAGRIAQPADIRRAMRLIGCACALSAIALWALAGLTWWAAR